MQALSSSDFLPLWERGSGLHSLDQGLLALSVALAGVPPETLADWPLGRRNLALIELHCASFHPQLQAWASCHCCGEKMEFELDAAALAGGEPEGNSGPGEAIQVRGRSFRLPTSRDLAQAALQGDSHAAAVCILERCRIDQAESTGWSEEDLERIGEALAQADPSAEIRVSLCCPGCRSEWEESLDLAAFLWAEIDAQARRLFLDVHAIASAYGWSETEILALSETRRRFYADMVRT